MEQRELTQTRVTAGELYREHAPFVAGFVLRLGAPRGEVEDLMQEVFLIAHKRGGFTPGQAKASTWLAEIALRVWANKRRSARRKPEEDTADAWVLSNEPDPERAIETKRSLVRVQQSLDALDFDHRAVFILFELEGESCAVIARMLEVPVGTVYRRLHTARARFRDAYARLAENAHGE